jgi:hypothetical protein
MLRTLNDVLCMLCTQEQPMRVVVVPAFPVPPIPIPVPFEGCVLLLHTISWTASLMLFHLLVISDHRTYIYTNVAETPAVLVAHASE